MKSFRFGTVRICLLVTLALVSWSFAESAEPTGWKAGTARVVITPDGPVWLSGYAGRDHAAEGKIHDLWAKALALEDASGKRVVLLTTDLLGMPRWLYDKICDTMQAKHGLDRSQVRITYSHTHCAPVVREDLEKMYPLDEKEKKRIYEYSDQLAAKLLKVLDDALADLRPALVSTGTGNCGFAVNRRNNKEPEVPAIRERGEMLNGPVDHTVPVIEVRDASDNSLRTIVFAYACHNTTMAFFQYSGDYAGFAQLAIEREHPGVTAMFVAGCGGDQNPLPRRELSLCQKYGEQLAASVEQVLKTGLRPLQPTIKTAGTSIDLPYARVFTREEFEMYAKNTEARRSNWAKHYLAELDAGRKLPTSAPYTVQAWRLGDQTWIQLAGEVLVDYSLRFKVEHGEGTWTTGYGHNLIAYIPSRRNIAEGGYESTSVFQYLHPAEQWSPDIEEQIASATKKLVEKVRQ